MAGIQTYCDYYMVSGGNKGMAERTKIWIEDQTGFSIRLYCFGAVVMTKEWLLNNR